MSDKNYEYLNGEGHWTTSGRNTALVLFEVVYRIPVPKPTPNEIDWAQFPEWAKSCATDNDGKTYIYSNVALWRGKSWDTTEDIKDVNISDFPGFKRGTVASIDSLLVRPIGE